MADAVAADATVAVAANFTAPANEIVALYKKLEGRDIALGFGSSGHLYAQIAHGAPFDAFLSADDVRTALAVKNGLAVPGSDFTYAVGKLVLFSPDPKLVDGQGAVLGKGGFRHLAIVNPKLAPYGAAAMEVLRGRGLSDAMSPRIVVGATVTQTYQFVVSGNAELGFVAYSLVKNRKGGSVWRVPQSLYRPIVQNAVLLKRGAQNRAARGFLAFLKSKPAQAVIERHGYALSAAE